MKTWLVMLLNHIAHPVFECENCIGMREHGCFCAAHNASAPCTPPTELQRIALWLLRKLI